MSTTQFIRGPGAQKQEQAKRRANVYWIILESPKRPTDIFERSKELYGYNVKQTQKAILQLHSRGDIRQCEYCYRFYTHSKGSLRHICDSCLVEIQSQAAR